ncbi:nuclear protein MDM1 isoform X2 [Syngnathoides biaculeatus]|uniref:nuclear protein MDM1 isoform X2 n=1 Tax=Syngnathoides biaculeatus TaxID=300417 RepID=UPI002ADE92B2|nr:nuclear protein MDM1 isoform X2 [Syngnathoides biaculeatus]
MLRPRSRGPSPLRLCPLAVEGQTHPIATETEYRCSFQGRPPARGARLRKHLDRRQRVPLFHTRASLKGREEFDDMPQTQHDGATRRRQATPPPQVHRRHRKQTEYEASFHHPTVGAAGETPQVAVLRQKASLYRRRAWGTNFSRQHLSQLTSQHNVLWEPSTDTSSVDQSPRPSSCPTVIPDPRSPPRMEVLDLASCCTSSSGAASPAHGRPVALPAGCETPWVAEGREDGVAMNSGPLHRRRLDVTAPGPAGVAVLVGRSSSEEAFQRRSVSVSMATDRANTPHLAKGLSRPCSPALFHRARSATKSRPIVSGLSPVPPPPPPPMHVIRGLLRDAEFQHNGELGLRFYSHRGFASNSS